MHIGYCKMSNIDKKTQSNLDTALFGLVLDKRQNQSLQAQLTHALRQLLLAGTNYSGARLPASRPLSQELSVSRTTVTAAYDQLISEGYLMTRVGGGTFVADDIPHLATPAIRAARAQKPGRCWVPFQPGVPDPSLFPHKTWSRHLERAWARPTDDLVARPDPLGWYALREAISTHLSTWRGLACRPEQVVITSGASEAFEIIFRGLLPPQQTTVIEDPGWPLMRDVLGTTGTTAHPIRIDDDGFDAARIAIKASVAIVTPSRHYPTGICTLDCGTMNFAEADYVMTNTPGMLTAMGRMMTELGVKPEIEAFDTGHLWYAKQLVADGVLDSPALVQLCMGVPWGAPDDLNTFMAMVNNVPDGWTFSAFGLGRNQMAYVAASVLAGGHVRVGLEDNLWLEKGVLAENWQLVERASTIIENMGARIMGPAEVRAKLGLQKQVPRG